jgi:hypothetical protein
MAIKLFLTTLLSISNLAFTFSQELTIVNENNFTVLKKQNVPIDTMLSGRGIVLDYKIISESEVIIIQDMGFTTMYYHLKSVKSMWDIILITSFGQTPQQRFRSSSALPKDYWEFKDKIITFKLVDIEKVEILENGKKIRDVDFKKIKERRQEYLESGKKYLDSLNHKKN